MGDGLVMKPLRALSLLWLGSMFQVFAFALSFPEKERCEAFTLLYYKVTQGAVAIQSGK